MKKYFVLMTLVFVASQAHAVRIIGNGGMVLICQTAPHVRLLDFHDGEVLMQEKLTDPKLENWERTVEYMIHRIRARFPRLAREMNDVFHEFKTQSRFIPNANIPDSGEAYPDMYPKDCQPPKQIATQKEPMFPKYPRYIIDRDIFNQMSVLHQAGLVVHEIAYRIGIRNGLEHSKAIRYVVSLFFSDKFFEHTDSDWIAGFQNARFLNYEVAGFNIPLFTGYWESCKPDPGRASCESPHVLMPAEFSFNKDDQLTKVSYRSMSAEIGYQDSAGRTFQLVAKEVRFVSLKPWVEIEAKGLVHANVGMDSEPTGVRTFRLNGRFVPGTGEICTSAASRGNEEMRECTTFRAAYQSASPYSPLLDLPN